MPLKARGSLNYGTPCTVVVVVVVVVVAATVVFLLLHSNLLAADRQRRRKRSSADLGTNYPGDLLSQVKPKRPTVFVPPLLKRNTIADFAVSRTYTSSASLFSSLPEQGTRYRRPAICFICYRSASAVRLYRIQICEIRPESGCGRISAGVSGRNLNQIV